MIGCRGSGNKTQLGLLAPSQAIGPRHEGVGNSAAHVVRSEEVAWLPCIFFFTLLFIPKKSNDINSSINE